MLPLRNASRVNGSYDDGSSDLCLRKKSSRPPMVDRSLPYNGSSNYYYNSMPPPSMPPPSMPPPLGLKSRRATQSSVQLFLGQDRLPVPVAHRSGLPPPNNLYQRAQLPISPLLNQVLTSKSPGSHVVFMVERKHEKPCIRTLRKVLIGVLILLVIVGCCYGLGLFRTKQIEDLVKAEQGCEGPNCNGIHMESVEEHDDIKAESDGQQVPPLIKVLYTVDDDYETFIEALAD